jgi:hypothetical protein
VPVANGQWEGRSGGNAKAVTAAAKDADVKEAKETETKTKSGKEDTGGPCGLPVKCVIL